MMSDVEGVRSVLVRKAHVSESLAIASILRQAFIEYEHLYTPSAFAATTSTSAQIQERWNEGPVWAAVQNENVVGTVAAVAKPNGLYIRSMAVLPFARGQGIAAQLLKVVESFAVSGHHEYLFLSTTPFLTSAIRVYERFGFQRSNEGPQNLFGTPLFTMIKQL
jgi:ribosomal protein S18 acetylase RimI-like enzyme